MQVALRITSTVFFNTLLSRVDFNTQLALTQP